MFENPPSLVPQDVTESPPNLLETAPTYLLPDPVVTDRAKRADFALGDGSPGVDALKVSFQQGNERQVRDMAAGQANAEFQQEKLNIIKAATASPAVTSEVLNTLVTVGTTPEANPDTVIEDKFARNYVSTGVIGEPEKNLVFQSAFSTKATETNEAIRLGTALTSRAIQGKNFLEEAQAAYDQVPWFITEPSDQQDKSGDLIKDILSMGFRQYVHQRNLVSSAPATSLLPGSNKLEQIQYLYLLPQDMFLPTLKAVAGPESQLWKDSPSAAMDFIKSVVSFSTSDAYVDNAFAISNVAGILPVGAATRAISRLRRGREIPFENVQSITQIAEDILKTSSTPPKTPGGTAAATAEDILKQSSAPPQHWYAPEAAALQKSYPKKTEAELNPRDFSVTVQGGKPRMFSPDGVEVQLSRTPQEGYVRLNIEPGSDVPTYTTKQGTFPHTKEGTFSMVEDRQTVYVNKKDYETLSSVLDETNPNLQILGDHEVGMEVRNRASNKTVKGTKVPANRISNEPKEGLYPIHLPEGNDKIAFEDFGGRITRVDQNQPYKVTFGPKIVSDTEVQTRKAVADIVKSTAEAHPQDALTKMGMQQTAAQVGAVETLSDKFQQVVKLGDVEAIRRNVPSMASPQTFFHNASSLSREAKDRLVTEAENTVNQLTASLADPARVERLTAEALQKAVEEARDKVKKKYNRASNSILDQLHHWDGSTNTYYVETRFGKKSGELFDDYATADHARKLTYRLGSSAEVKQEGNKFYLSHIQQIDETTPTVRGSLIVSGNETPRGFWNTLVNAATGRLGGLGFSLRSSAHTTSEFSHANRVTATHAPSTMRKALEDTAESLGGMTKAERHEMQRILEHNRDYVPPGGDPSKDRGMFYKSAFEFETAFNSMHGKLPTEKQIAAYDQFVRLSDLDWVLRAMDDFRDKSRIGIRNYRFDLSTSEGKVKTDFIHGKEVPDFDPVNTQDANIYVVPQNRFTQKFDKTVDDEEMKKMIKEGRWKIVQLFKPHERPLRETTGIKDEIHFVVTDKFDDKAIRWGEGIDYRPGGHVIYQDQWFMKVPMIGKGTKGRDTHFGDVTMKSFASEREGREWIAKYNQARLYLKEGKEAELKAMFDRGEFPETLQEFKQWYTGGSFDIKSDNPFVLTATGRDTFQSSEELTALFPGLKDQFSSYNLSQTQGTKFLAERDRQLSTIAKTGTEEHPVYTNVPSRLYDPYTSLQKGLSEIVRSRWMGDYKHSAAESWVQEFWHLFDQSKLPREKISQNSVYWLYHAPGNIDTGMSKANPELVQAAMVSRRNILQFIGARDEVGSILQGLEKKVINWVEGKTSAKFAGQTEETFLPAIKSAPEYARRAVFETTIGSFNPVQLIQQAQGMTHVLALSPVNGMQGTTASALARLYRYTEDAGILDDMANKAAALGWKKEHFVEAYDAWKAAGVHTVAGETSALSTIADPSLFKGAFETFLDKGRIFFKAGEAIVRDTSFFTAYLDWRKSNPTAKLTNKEMVDILGRFDTLSLNMTRASNAAYNEGLLSIPTQFWTWNARFTEQMLGKTLTWGEWSRALTAYSFMYGIPATMGGVTFGVVPMMNYNDIRKYALANGYNVSDKYYQALSEGIPAMLTNLVTGHQTDFKRFGPDATQVRDIIDGKKSVMEVFFGASGNFVQQIARTVYPFFSYAISAVKGNTTDFPVMANDFLNVAEVVSSFSNGEKMAVALATGKLWSRQEGLMAQNLDTFESFMLGLGLNPKRVSDAYLKLDYTKEITKAQEKLKPQLMENWKLGLQAAARGDMATMVHFFTRARTLAAASDMSPEDTIAFYRQAMRGTNIDLVDQAEQQWRQNLPQLRQLPQMRQYLENIEKNRTK